MGYNSAGVGSEKDRCAGVGRRRLTERNPRFKVALAVKVFLLRLSFMQEQEWIQEAGAFPSSSPSFGRMCTRSFTLF